MDIQSR